MSRKAPGEYLRDEGAEPHLIYIFEILLPKDGDEFVVNLTFVSQTGETHRVKTSDEVWDIWYQNLIAGNFAFGLRVFDNKFFQTYKRPEKYRGQADPKETADNAKE
nr:hypothetical protein [Sicyoidochytrium minutum DNA virus]